MTVTEQCPQPTCHGTVTVTHTYDDNGNTMSTERGPCSTGAH
ncbi:hypothetical protein ACH41E_02745 [Streptomyces sp. NPDC020412]